VKKIICFLLTLTFFACSACSNSKQKAANEAVSSIKVGSGPEELNYTERSGVLLGPECFSMKSDGGFYLLDTAKNRILSFDSSGKKDDSFKLPDDLSVVKISVGPDDRLYVLDASKGIIGTVESENIIRYQISSLMIEPLIDFGITKSNIPYLVLADQEGGQSYLFKLENQSANIIETKKGRLTPEEKIYKTLLIKEKGYEIGHACIMQIYDFNNKLENELLIESENWLVGASYLGEEDDQIIVQTHETDSDTDKANFNDLVKKINKDGKITEISILPQKYKYISNDTVQKGSSLYHLNTGEHEVTLEKLNFVSADS